jgi:hypothetical protein
MSDWLKLMTVFVGTIVAAIIGVMLAQNVKCVRCGERMADCECW